MEKEKRITAPDGCEIEKVARESYNTKKPAENRNCPLYGIKEGGEK